MLLYECLFVRHAEHDETHILSLRIQMNTRIREKRSVCQEQKANARLKDERISELRRRVHEQKYQVMLGLDEWTRVASL